MRDTIEEQWPQPGVFQSKVLGHKLLGQSASTLRFSRLLMPAGYARLDEPSITLVVVSGAAPWAPREHPFPHGWTRRVKQEKHFFDVVFDVPTRTVLFTLWGSGLAAALRVRARVLR